MPLSGEFLPTDLGDALDRAQETARGVTASTAEEVDREARWPEATIRALQRAGLGGLVVPEEHDGLGHGLYALARVCEIIGRECASGAICFGMHCVGSAVLAAKATPEQAERYLRPIVAGEHLTTLSLSEPGTGAHFYLPQTELVREQDGFVVNGTKTFVTNGTHADSYVVSTVAADPAAPPGQFSCVIVEADAGMRWGEPWQGLGMRGNDSRTVELQDVRLSPHALLGQEGDQLWYVFEVVAPYFLMAMAGTYLGVAQAALDEASAHLTQRVYGHSGSRVSAQPVIQHRLGEVWAKVERARRLTYSAASRGDEGDPDALPAVLSSKAEVAQAAVEVINETMTLVGGIGYRDNSRLARCLRDARAAHVMAPTTDLLRTWVGRALLGLPLLGE